MRKCIILLTVFISFSGLFSQTSMKSPNDPGRKVENIKIIDGDTVFHEVRFVKIDRERHEMEDHLRIHRRSKRMDEDEAFDSIVKNVNIYMNIDDNHKRMMVSQMKMSDNEVDSILKSVGMDEDIIIDIDDNKDRMKIVKVKMEKGDEEEIEVVEIRKREGFMGNERRRGKDLLQDDNLKAYPNPAGDVLNLEFTADGENTVIKVTDADGKFIFEKTYREPGRHKEVVKLGKAAKGMAIVQMKSGKKSITRKINVE